MKKSIGEVFVPIVDFYRMRKSDKGEKVVLIVLPIIIGVLTYLVGQIFSSRSEIDVVTFNNDVLNQLLTVLALFVSFCMAYLSILLTSSSKNVEKLKSTKSSYVLGDTKCTLYQVNSNEITYILLIEILFLMVVFFQKLGALLLCNEAVKIILCINVVIFMHILFAMLVIVKNMYFSFWRNE